MHHKRPGSPSKVLSIGSPAPTKFNRKASMIAWHLRNAKICRQAGAINKAEAAEAAAKKLQEN